MCRSTILVTKDTLAREITVLYNNSTSIEEIAKVIKNKASSIELAKSAFEQAGFIAKIERKNILFIRSTDLVIMTRHLHKNIRHTIQHAIIACEERETYEREKSKLASLLSDGEGIVVLHWSYGLK